MTCINILRLSVLRQILCTFFCGLLALIPLQSAQAVERDSPLEGAMQAVLTLRSADADNRFLGSAFLWGVSGAVAVTNAHVVGAAEEVRLVDRDGQEQIGRVIARDALRDVAVISVASKGQRGLVPAPGPAALAQEVYALGAPLGVEFTLTEGLISAAARQVDIAVPIHMLQHDAAVNPGSSGGPLVDAEGRLIGMNSQIADGSRVFVGIAYAIPAADLARIVQGLIEETLRPYPALGLRARALDRSLAAMLDVPAQGLLVEGSVKGGLAEVAGLQAGDILLEVDGNPISAPGDFAFLIEAALPEETALLTVLRQGERLQVQLDFVSETEASGLSLRGIGPTAPERVRSYTFGALGLVLGAEGEVIEAAPNGLVGGAGLSPGERILAVNGAAMEGAALKALEISAPVLVRVRGVDGQTRHVVMDPWGDESGLRPVGGANVLDPSVIVF
ncbi:trypsin-like peptidase domain-containing protein [Xinfangfangia sp. CPCC 101601]|uniref:Trypsin-like peptidase domain-containing protein n=1 Tax=Pseudogemmobacter lacusdianii TaxID=3069608 RepID=A0ABU0VWG0_9RHOB|nr:trypsin-like peptidase domain-containing protein [Xinfangfangia sp. CPCC 101601]MDQ2065963.1 trypsin-like peptidase domain-containing protein [Xinfangfangia sp. CPCC 101601]